MSPLTTTTPHHYIMRIRRKFTRPLQCLALCQLVLFLLYITISHVYSRHQTHLYHNMDHLHVPIFPLPNIAMESHFTTVVNNSCYILGTDISLSLRSQRLPCQG